MLYRFKESENTGGWDSAIRLDGNIPLDRNISGRTRIAWHNQFAVSDDIELRGVLLVGHRFGHHAQKGMSIETREEATYKLSGDYRIGAQMFKNFGMTSHFYGFNRQVRQLSPVLKSHVGDHVKYEFSTLFGLTDKTSDVAIRFFVSYTP